MALTTKQRNLIAFMVANPLLPETVCAKECGVPNSTYFYWKKQKTFTDELDRQIKAKWKDAERMATETMIELAREGDFRANKYILDNLGYKAKDEVEVKGELETVININID